MSNENLQAEVKELEARRANYEAKKTKTAFDWFMSQFRFVHNLNN